MHCELHCNLNTAKEAKDSWCSATCCCRCCGCSCGCCCCCYPAGNLPNKIGQQQGGVALHRFFCPPGVSVVLVVVLVVLVFVVLVLVVVVVAIVVVDSFVLWGFILFSADWVVKALSSTLQLLISKNKHKNNLKLIINQNDHK